MKLHQATLEFFTLLEMKSSLLFRSTLNLLATSGAIEQHLLVLHAHRDAEERMQANNPESKIQLKVSQKPE